MCACLYVCICVVVRVGSRGQPELSIPQLRLALCLKLQLTVEATLLAFVCLLTLVLGVQTQIFMLAVQVLY